MQGQESSHQNPSSIAFQTSLIEKLKKFYKEHHELIQLIALILSASIVVLVILWFTTSSTTSVKRSRISSEGRKGPRKHAEDELREVSYLR